MFTKHPIIKALLIVCLLISIITACGQSPSASHLQATATMLSLQQTMVALDMTVQAYSATQTEAAKATATPIPTDTPIPTETSIPTATVTPGPLVIHDDFSADTGRWIECGQCRIENGSLHMGPYPISEKGEGYLAICSDCGIVQDYKMGVDATFVDGYTDRGFGLVIREENGSYADVEITTWQVYGAWAYNKSQNAWGNILGGDGWKLSGTLYPSYGANRLEVEVKSQGGTSTLTIHINGQLVNTGTFPAVSGRVGLVVGLHSLGVLFDNFYFEGYPISKPADTLQNSQG